jgi:sugar O-acyltransferase (sialic acid O-acetyltransferase NeuD family)
MESIAILGAGGHAKVVAQTIRRLSSWMLVGAIDEVDPGRAGTPFEGVTVLGGREVLEPLLRSGTKAIALGFGDNAARLQRFQELLALGFEFPTLVDPHAVVADGVPIGAGTYVAAGAIVQPGAKIGSQVILNTAAVVEHDCRVGDGVHVCPGACLAGHVQVGRGAWIGAGSVVKDRVSVGDDAFVGIGSVVLSDIPSKMLVHGHPARSIRKVAE